MKKPLYRYCPNIDCRQKIQYSTREGCRQGERKNSVCRKCATINDYKKNPLKNKGIKNGRFGKKLINVFVKKYGENNGTLKYENWKNNLNKFKEGINNPQYGKKSNINSGLSYSGWYKNLYFRSSYELMFILKFENDFMDLPSSAESGEFTVPYNMSGKTYNYFPDFYSKKTNTIYEIKPKKYLYTRINLLKFKAAFHFFRKKSIKYVIITENELAINNWQIIIYDILYNLILDKQITLTEKSLNKLKSALKKKNMNIKLKNINGGTDITEQ